MKPTYFVAAYCLATLFASCGVFGSWAVVPLSERVSEADVIVVGKLSDIVERDFSLTQGGAKAYTTHYDRGAIISPRVLKGHLAGRGYVRVAFPSKDQDQHPFQHMLISHSAGEEGVWLLTKDRVLTGYDFVGGPQNPLPLEAESAVAEALKATGRK